MAKKSLFCVLIGVISSEFVIGAVNNLYGITLDGVKCGQRSCKLSQYCSPLDGTCQDCSSACDKSTANFEEAICEKQCQDYLHDLRYVRKTSANDDDLRGTVDKLSRMVTVTLTLIILLLIILTCIFCFQLYRWKTKKNITWDTIKAKVFRKSDPPRNTSTNTSSEDTRKKDLRLEMPSPTINSEHSPVTVSTSISRRPAEDSTLDYAYDNPAMTKPYNTNTSF